MTRKLLPLLMTGLVAVAHGQADPNDATITAAFAAWRIAPAFSVQLTGTQLVNGVSYDVASDLYFSLEPDAAGQTLAKFDIIRQVRRTGTQAFQTVQRVTGDGTTLYDYRPLNGEYSARAYGDSRGPVRSAIEQAKYLQTALAMVGHSVGDTEALSVRLLREVYGSDAAAFHRWIPGAAPQSTVSTISYAAGAPSYRSFQFNFSPTTGQLLTIDAHDSRRNGQMVADYTMTPSSQLPLLSGLFQPYPLAVVGRWRLVADIRK